MRFVKHFFVLLIVFCGNPCAPSHASAEGSIHHGNNQRTGYTDAALPRTPVLQWTYTERHPPRHAWKEPNRELQYIDFDYATQVTVSDGLMIFGSSADHAVRAIDLMSGTEHWHFYTEGPVRFAPAADSGRVYIASDDGYLYALDVADGSLLWKFRGGPSNGKLIGNEQMISHWPLRSGVLVEAGKLYLTAGMWSRDGVFVYCLDAADGSVIWKNDTSGFHFTSLPHSSGLAGVPPQGHLTLQHGLLGVPTGRGAPACFDAETGEFLYYENGQGYKAHQEGGSRVMAWENWLIFKRRIQHINEDVRYEQRLAGPGAISGLYAIDLETGLAQWALTDKSVAAAHGDAMILGGNGPVIRVSISELLEAYAQYWNEGKELKDDPNVLPHGQDYVWTEPKVPPYPAWMSPLPYAKWEVDIGYAFTLLQAGDTVLAGGRERVSGIDFNSGEILWQHDIEGDARSICAADGRIVVSSTAGKLYVFGEDTPVGPRDVAQRPEMPTTTLKSRELVQDAIDATDIRAGYALVLGAGNGHLLCELARQTELTVYCLEPDAAKVGQVRQMLDRAGLLGVRVGVHVGTFEQLPYNPYWANLILWGDTLGSSIGLVNAAELYRVLRPYGGIALQLSGTDSVAATHAWLAGHGIPENEVKGSAIGLIVTRGALPGAGQWTHAYANIGRTGSSEDALARLPLGMLWWGGPGPARIFTRHSRAPVPIFSSGKLFIQGQHDVFAVDAYNGREMWNRHLENVARVPAANRGGNIVADDDSVYCIQETKCLRLDAQTGETRTVYEFPLKAQHRAVFEDLTNAYPASAKTRVVWEYLGVVGNFIIGSLADEVIYETTPSQPYFDAAQQARYLFAFSKSGGRPVWQRKMDQAVSPNAIVANAERVYYLDRTDERMYRQTKRRGNMEGVSVLKAADLATGELLWERPGIRVEHKALILKDDVIVAYPNPIEHEVQEGDSGVAVYSAIDGTLLWEEKMLAGVSGNGRGAIIRHTFVIGDTLFLPWAHDLRTGEEKLLHNNPLTGCGERFDIEAQNFCGTIAAGKNLVAYRSASIGFQEIGRDSGSFWLPELRPSCWISVLPAGGLVLTPEGSATCLCPYTYKTSAALVPVDRHEDWALYLSGNKQDLKQFKRQETQQTPPPAFNKLCINLNAPGDRMDAQGQVWLAFPRPMARQTTLRYLDTPLPLEIRGVQDRFHVNADFLPIAGTTAPWLFTSGLEGPLNISIQLPTEETHRYRIQLLFTETDNVAPGDRVFDVVIQGKTVLSRLDVIAKAAKPNQAWIEAIDGISAAGALSIKLVPRKGKAPRLCSLVVVEDE